MSREAASRSALPASATHAPNPVIGAAPPRLRAGVSRAQRRRAAARSAPARRGQPAVRARPATGSSAGLPARQAAAAPAVALELALAAVAVAAAASPRDRARAACGPWSCRRPACRSGSSAPEGAPQSTPAGPCEPRSSCGAICARTAFPSSNSCDGPTDVGRVRSLVPLREGEIRRRPLCATKGRIIVARSTIALRRYILRFGRLSGT